MLKRFYYKTKSIIGLSISLAKANFKVRNEGSYLGIFWYLLEPLAFFVILLFIGNTISVNTITYYPIYLLLGLIIFNFFRATTNIATGAIRSNSNFIKSLKIDKEAFILSGMFQFTISHIFEFIILIGFMIFFKMNLAWVLFYPVIFILFFFFTTGISFILSVLGVYANDLKNVWSVFTRLLWFATPIFYYVRGGELIQTINMFNPLYHFINISRELIIFHRIPEMKTFLLAIFSSIIIFALGIYIFEKNKDKLAEKI